MEATATNRSVDPDSVIAHRQFSRLAAALVLAVLSAIFIVSVLYVAAARQASGQYFTLCGLKALTGLPCPGCGLAHSFCAMGKGDFAGAFDYNLLGPPLFIVLALIWIRSACLLFGKTRFALALDRMAKRFRLLRAFAIAFAIYGLARILCVLVFH